MLRLSDFNEENLKEIVRELKELKDIKDGLSEIVDILLAKTSKEKISKPVLHIDSVEVKKLNYLVKSLKATASRLELENNQLREIVRNISHEKVLSVNAT